MIYMGKTGAPLFIIYLWVTFGIGIRYGGRYLIFSAILNIVSFCVVIYINPIWTSTDNMYISIGFLLSLIILPAYVYMLIAKLADALESEKNANQIKKTFFANMNHELRTPLNSILNITDLLQTYKMSGKIYGMLGMIRTSTNTLLKIVNGILDISRIEAGQYKINEYVFDLYSLIFEIKQLFSSQAEKKGIKFFVYIDPGVNQYLVGAGDQIKQILINLVGNAVKFTDKGFVKLSVNAIRFGNDKQQISFQVEDSGLGIGKKFQKQIFKPFTQADPAITRKYGGTGLGLTISDELIKLMRGKLLLESTLGVGTIFTFTVPLCVERVKSAHNFAGVKLYPLNLEDSYIDIINFYASQGVTIVKSYPQGNTPIISGIDDKTIIILGNLADRQNEEDSINSLREQKELVVIKTSGSKENFTHNAITSISQSCDKDSLLNVLKICMQFLPNYLNRITRLPLTSQPLNILLVEDDNTLREIQAIIFSKAGHKLTMAHNGEDALSMLVKNEYDLAILDLHLPGLSGLEVALRYKELISIDHAKLILLTADSDNSRLTLEMKKIFSLILTKPVEPGHILNKVYELFELPVISKNDQKEYIHEEYKDPIIYDNNHYLYESLLEQKVRYFGKEAFMKILNIYDKEINSLISDLFIAGKNSQKIQDAIHRIKGASLSLGAYELSMATRILLEVHEELSFKDKEYLSNLHKEFMSCALTYV